MKHQITTAILAIFLLTAGAALAAPAVSIGAGSVEFAAGGAGTLTVSGPEGYEHSQAIDGHASLSLYDEAGNALADGAYSWQITLDGVAPEERSERAVKGQSTSGVFTIDGGSVVNPHALEDGLTKDQVFLDDLIVDGSACVGQDCANGESFGFDTLRLKENNLRIKFDDTSSSSSFPNNDWQLTANDSANGGANKFSIDDITHGKTPFTVGANAPSNALYLEGSTGDVGLGTATPVVELHVVDGDSPTLRLEQDGSSGFTPQTWDVAGNEAAPVLAPSEPLEVVDQQELVPPTAPRSLYEQGPLTTVSSPPVSTLKPDSKATLSEVSVRSPVPSTVTVETVRASRASSLAVPLTVNDESARLVGQLSQKWP